MPFKSNAGTQRVEVLQISIPPLLVFQKVCLLFLNSSKLFMQTFWSPTAEPSPKKTALSRFKLISLHPRPELLL
jgi:hypothetical protein